MCDLPVTVPGTACTRAWLVSRNRLLHSDSSALTFRFAPSAVSSATQEDLIKKRKAFEDGVGSSHWPQALQVMGGPMMVPKRPDGSVCKGDRKGPKTRPELSERAFKLTGIPYIQASA